MCGTCGCGQPGETIIRRPGEPEQHEHLHEHDHMHGSFKHAHSHAHSHHHPHPHDQADDKHPHQHHDAHHEHEHSREINIELDIMRKNDLLAERNRGYFEARAITVFNLVSSPGSGKTTVLERTINELSTKKHLFVIEGDQQTMLDAERIQKAGAPVVQVNTGNGCHLDASMVNQAVKQLNITDGAVLLIENVGNLVCPALFDLGESKRVVIISVTEGEDKPLKYPNMFQSSQLCLINKADLLPYTDFNVEKFREYALRVNHHLEFITISAKTGEGFGDWLEWISGH